MQLILSTKPINKPCLDEGYQKQRPTEKHFGKQSLELQLVLLWAGLRLVRVLRLVLAVADLVHASVRAYVK